VQNVNLKTAVFDSTAICFVLYYKQEQQCIAVRPKTCSSCLFTRWRLTQPHCSVACASNAAWPTADTALGNLLIKN